MMDIDIDNVLAFVWRKAQVSARTEDRLENIIKDKDKIIDELNRLIRDEHFAKIQDPPLENE